MKKTLLALVATSVVFVAPAFAADIAVKAPPPAPLSSWSGFYFGGNLGAGWGGRNFGYAANDPGSAALFSPILGGQPPSGSVHASGALGGFQIGRNWQFARQWLPALRPISTLLVCEAPRLASPSLASASL